MMGFEWGFKPSSKITQSTVSSQGTGNVMIPTAGVKQKGGMPTRSKKRKNYLVTRM